MVFMNSEVSQLLEKLKEDLIENFMIDGIILFGSFVHGQEDEKSDIDLAIITDDEEISRYLETYKCQTTNPFDFWIIPKAVLQESAELHEYRYGINLLADGSVLYDSGEVVLLRKRLSQTKISDKTTDLYRRRVVEYSSLAEHHLLHVLRSMYQGSLNAVFIYFSRKGIEINPRDIVNVMEGDENLRGYVDFLKDLKQSLRNMETSRIVEFRVGYRKLIEYIA